MTTDRAIEILKEECYVFNPLNFDRSTMVNTALDVAINALKQGEVVNKIKSEIDRQQTWLFRAGYNTYNIDIAFGAIKSVVERSAEE